MFQGQWKSLGYNAIIGFINGWNAVNVASYLINKIQNGYEALKHWLLSKSPSKRFAFLGRDTALGFAKGVDDHAHKAAEAGIRMAKKVRDASRVDLPDVSRTITAGLQTNGMPEMPQIAARGTGRSETQKQAQDFALALREEIGRLVKENRQMAERHIRENKQIAEQQARDAVKIALAALASDAGLSIQDRNLHKTLLSTTAATARAQ